MPKSFDELHPPTTQKQTPLGTGTPALSSPSNDFSVALILIFGSFPVIATLFQQLIDWIFRGCLRIGAGCVEETIWYTINYPGVFVLQVIQHGVSCSNLPENTGTAPCIESIEGFGFTVAAMVISVIVWGGVGYVFQGMLGKGRS